MDNAQLLKGILEGCILSIISGGETYGYHILSILEKHGFTDIGEGTLYPVLTRLENKGYIICRIGKSPFGPRRKYYSITDIGLKSLKEFIISYEKIIKISESIIKETLGGMNHELF
jgi:PadR family transcriptional regulator PadR